MLALDGAGSEPGNDAPLHDEDSHEQWNGDDDGGGHAHGKRQLELLISGELRLNSFRVAGQRERESVEGCLSYCTAMWMHYANTPG